MCFVDQGNETPEAGPAGIMFKGYIFKLWCNNVNKSLTNE